MHSPVCYSMVFQFPVISFSKRFLFLGSEKWVSSPLKNLWTVFYNYISALLIIGTCLYQQDSRLVSLAKRSNVRLQIKLWWDRAPLQSLKKITRFFFNSAPVLVNFSWIKLQMLLRCCLLHITIIILRRILYLLLP